MTAPNATDPHTADSAATDRRAVHPHSQSQYQVRFDWADAGARAIGAGADVIVWVDVLDADQPALPDLPSAAVVSASLRDRGAVAEWVLARQGDKGDRFIVAVVAAGERHDDGSLRFALEDLLAAGSVIDALAELGIDYCSPEAAAATAAFTGLRNATGHLIASSASGQRLARAGRGQEIDTATDIDSSSEVRVLRELSTAL